MNDLEVRGARPGRYYIDMKHSGLIIIVANYNYFILNIKIDGNLMN